MTIKTTKEAKEAIHKWLEDNGHSIKEIETNVTTFKFEIDYPVGNPSKQIVANPKKVPDLIAIVHNTKIGTDISNGFQKMKPKIREIFIHNLKKELARDDNTYQFKFDSDGILSNVVFQYNIYFDGLSKDNLYKALATNYKSFFYIRLVLQEQMGVSKSLPTDASRIYG